MTHRAVLASLSALASLALAACAPDAPPAPNGEPTPVDDAGAPSTPPPSTPPPSTPPPSSGVCEAPIDVVFVLDVTTSMADDIEAARLGMEQVWRTANALRPGAQIGLVVFGDDVLPVQGCAPFASLEALQAELARWRDFTRNDANPQPAGSPYENVDCAENALDALHVAATQCPWRDGATRLVVHVTDDTFAQAPTVLATDEYGGGGIAVGHTYAQTVEALRAAEVRVGAFAVPGTSAFCGEPVEVGVGYHAPYLGMPPIPAATGGRAFDLLGVRSGALDMGAAVSELVGEEHCTPFI